MPRVSKLEQFNHYQKLREAYLAWPMALIRLAPPDQAAIALFYQPEREHTLESLRAMQQEMKQLEPSLPHRAGKAYIKVLRLLPLVQERASRPRRKGAPYELFVFSELNESIDPAEMARIILRMAMEAEERDERDRAA